MLSIKLTKVPPLCDSQLLLH